MKVCINLNPALYQPTGVGVHARELFIHLTQLCKPDMELYGLSSSWKYRLEIPQVERNHIIDLRLPSELFNFVVNILGLIPIELLTLRTFDIVHAPYHIILPAFKAKKVITVHDLYFLTLSKNSFFGNVYNDKTALRKSVIASDAIICDSHFTKQRLIEIFPESEEKATVIYNGFTRSARKNGEDKEYVCAEKTKMKLPDEYVVFIGTIEKRKNVLSLVDAIKMLNSRNRKIGLVIAGKSGYEGDRVLRAIEGVEYIKYFGYVTDEQKNILYQCARALVFPSFEEGFGMPLLESMSWGVPVIASRGSALEEIAKDSAWYIEENTAEGISDAINYVLEHEDLRGTLIKKGYRRIEEFSWENAALQVYDLYKKIL